MTEKTTNMGCVQFEGSDLAFSLYRRESGAYFLDITSGTGSISVRHSGSKDDMLELRKLLVQGTKGD